MYRLAIVRRLGLVARLLCYGGKAMEENKNYLDQQAEQDFDFFLDHYNEFFQRYGTCFIAIRDGRVLGTYSSAREAAYNLNPDYPVGSYILQECNGEENAYTTRIMGVSIHGE